MSAPFSLVLTQSAAERMFPRRDPVGAVIELPGLGKFTVTGLLPDPPVRSHIRFDFLMSFSTITSMTVEERANISVYSFEDIWRGLVYVLLAPDAGAPQLDQALESLAMVIYNVEGRIKEVGIRKVLGAGEGNIVWELSKGFFLLLGISIVIAVPLTLFVASLWLQNFLIRIEVGPVTLLSGVGIMLVLGLLTVISQTLRAARNNPVEALRTE